MTNQRVLLVSGAVLLGAALLAILAFTSDCGDDDDDGDPGTPTATAAANGTPTGQPTATAAGSPTEAPFSGGRDPVEKAAPSVPPVAIQVDTRYAEHGDYDRVVFDFEENSPGYVVEYVDPPIVADPSGLDVEIDGSAFLQVRFLGAQAHDEAGNTTVDQLEIKPGLGTVVEIERTSDFEGQVVWVLGLTEELDFRVIDLTDPPRVAVDIGHP